MSASVRTNRQRHNRSIYQVHYALQKRVDEDEMAKPCMYMAPGSELQKYDSQVAGHGHKADDTKYLGILQYGDGTILKPILKEAQKREVDFYERVYSSSNPDLKELKKFIPNYYGCKKFTYHGYENDYIIMSDLTSKMLEPCVMDAKIGRRTWDPLASEEKRKNEESKYVDCKREVAFCVPGFQVYKLATGKVHKYGKDYGKKLNGQTVRDAIKVYLNATGNMNLCRALILQFLTELWKIQKWASKQTSVKLYASSLLLIYDAQRLRECCGENDLLCTQFQINQPSKCVVQPGLRRKSIHSMHSSTETSGSNFSGQISSKGPIYKKIQPAPMIPMTLARSSFEPINVSPNGNTWHSALDKLNRSHSFHNNYDDKLSKIKMNYRAVLDQLSDDSELPKKLWGGVKIIDFAHAFFNEDDQKTIDSNFSEGIDNFVNIFEDFLRSTDDQVF